MIIRNLPGGAVAKMNIFYATLVLFDEEYQFQMLIHEMGSVSGQANISKVNAQSLSQQLQDGHVSASVTTTKG